MNMLTKGLVLGGVQLALVLSLGGKLLIDRATLPKVWVKTAPYDPNLPVRGRYVSLRVMAEARGFEAGAIYSTVRLSVDGDKLIAQPSGNNSDVMATISGNTANLAEPVAYFIPEKIPDPSRRPADEELWVEVTVPRKGPPRPIRLGVKKDGVLTPLEIR